MIGGAPLGTRPFWVIHHGPPTLERVTNHGPPDPSLGDSSRPPTPFLERVTHHSPPSPWLTLPMVLVTDWYAPSPRARRGSPSP